MHDDIADSGWPNIMSFLPGHAWLLSGCNTSSQPRLLNATQSQQIAVHLSRLFNNLNPPRTPSDILSILYLHVPNLDSGA